jgi:hypothetical protein
VTIDDKGREAAARMRARLGSITVPEPRTVVRRARHRRQIVSGVAATVVVAVTVAIVASLVGGSPKQVDVQGGGVTSSSIGSTSAPSSTRVPRTQPPASTTVATTSTSRPTGTSILPITSTPTVVIGSWTGREPVMIYFSGDSGDIVSDLKWSTWTPDLAVAHGTWQYLDCVPNCAQGTSTPYPVTITLTRPQADRFTRLLEQTDGPHGYTMTFSAPNLGQGACTTSDQSSCAFR